MDYDKSMLTDRSRRVLVLAREEAARLGHAKCYVSHLLMGLAKEGSGVAAYVLNRLGLGLQILRDMMQTDGSIVRLMTDEVSDDESIELVIRQAFEVAGNFDHQYVGTEHLLLGLLQFPNGGLDLLNRHGLTAADVRSALMTYLGENESEDEESNDEITHSFPMHEISRAAAEALLAGEAVFYINENGEREFGLLLK